VVSALIRHFLTQKSIIQESKIRPRYTSCIYNDRLIFTAAYCTLAVMRGISQILSEKASNRDFSNIIRSDLKYQMSFFVQILVV